MSHNNETANKTIEARLLWLADIEEIKQLKARYALACDNDYEPDTIAEMFTEDGVWDGGFLGRLEGRESIREFFKGASQLVSFVFHEISNPIITIDGDRATGHWYLHQAMVLRPNNDCFWFIAQYEDEYVRTAEGWKYQNLLVKARALSPYDQGFGKVLMAEMPS